MLLAQGGWTGGSDLSNTLARAPQAKDEHQEVSCPLTIG